MMTIQFSHQAKVFEHERGAINNYVRPEKRNWDVHIPYWGVDIQN